MLNFAAICPHPPIIIPTIGGEEIKKVQKTINTMEKLADDFAAAKPETTIIISPHGPAQASKMTITGSPKMVGELSNFGDYQKFRFENDLETIKQIKKASDENNLRVETIDCPILDHGTLVPLWFLTKNYRNTKLIPMAFSFLDYRDHFNFGKTIGKLLMINNTHYAIVASGDLSHRLTKDAPAGYSLRGKEFDEKLVGLLEKNEIEAILNLDEDLIDEAGECGLRSIIILLGILSNFKHKTKILSYEGPFGVGYLVANFEII